MKGFKTHARLFTQVNANIREVILSNHVNIQKNQSLKRQDLHKMKQKNNKQYVEKYFRMTTKVGLFIKVCSLRQE